jgi:hypothetical protein
MLGVVSWLVWLVVVVSAALAVVAGIGLAATLLIAPVGAVQRARTGHWPDWMGVVARRAAWLAAFAAVTVGLTGLFIFEVWR